MEVDVYTQYNSTMNLSTNPLQNQRRKSTGHRPTLPFLSPNENNPSQAPKLKCFELLAIRQKNKAESKAKKAKNGGEDETRLDTTVTVMDLDNIDPIRGTFKMKFKIHAIYKFDDNKLKQDEGENDEPPLIYPLHNIVNNIIDASNGANNAVTDNDVSDEKTPAEIEAEIENEKKLKKISAKNAKVPGNVFYKLFYKKYTDDELERLKSDPKSVKPKIRPAKAIEMEVEDDDSKTTNTFVKSYSLTADETKLFMDYYSVPVVQVDNLYTEAGSSPINWEDNNRVTLYFEAIAPDSKLKDGQLSIMWTRDYEYIMKEVFELHYFPFDFQDLSVELSIGDEKKYDLRISNVRFIKASLEQTEWTVLEPNVKWNDGKDSSLKIRVGRKSGYYIQNVVLLMASLSVLGIMVFFTDISDIGSRTSISLTLLLTLVAFKFVLASQLPVISYNTLLDYYVMFTTYTLVIMTICALIPFNIENFLTDDNYSNVPQLVNGYFRYIFAGILAGGTLIWFVVSLALTRLSSNPDDSKAITYTNKDENDTFYDYKIKYWVRSSDVTRDESNNQKANKDAVPTKEQNEQNEMEPYFYRLGFPQPRKKLVVRKKASSTL